MRKLRQKGLTYTAIGRQAGMTRQGAHARLNKNYIPHPLFSEVWTASRNWLFHHYRRNAQKRGYAWQLSLSVFTSITQMACFYYGDQPKQRLKGRRGDFIYNGLDRKNNTKGYSQKNVVPCCGCCNRMKGTLSALEFQRRVQKISLHFA